MADEEYGTLKIGEHHPAADSAMTWFKRYVRRNSAMDIVILQQSLASTALSGNRLAECCSETLRRLLAGEPVSDRYLLGLIWTIREMEEMEEIKGGEKL